MINKYYSELKRAQELAEDFYADFLTVGPWIGS